MIKKLDYKKTSRATSYEFLDSQILPTVTLIKRLDVTKVFKYSKKGHKFNCILNYLIVKSALNIPEFYFVVDGNTKELYESDKLSLIFMAKKKDGGLSYCQVPYEDNFYEFEKIYLQAIDYCYQNNCHKFIEGFAKIGTSTVPWTNLVGAINGYGPNFTNPFIIIPKYEKKFFKYYVNISFQSHHLQMDGEQVCKYLENLQKNIKEFKI